MFAKEFVVDGIRYRALPDKKAAKIARSLYQKFLPFKGDQSDLGKGAEASQEGRMLIAKHIYAPHAGSEAALQYADRLGTADESYWSSWFFGATYGHNPEYRALSSVGSKLFAYPYAAGMQNRNAIELDPLAFKGKKDYVMFSFDEAPADIGDSIASIDRSAPLTFDTFKQYPYPVQSHGRVIADIKGRKAVVHGGNESGTVGKSEISLTGSYKVADVDSTGRHIHPSSPNRYTGLLKRVKVLGENTPALIIVSYIRKGVLTAAFGLAAFGVLKGLQRLQQKGKGAD